MSMNCLVERLVDQTSRLEKFKKNSHWKNCQYILFSQKWRFEPKIWKKKKKKKKRIVLFEIAKGLLPHDIFEVLQQKLKNQAITIRKILC